MKKFCVSCGSLLDDGTKFCTKCGQQVLETQVEPQIVQQRGGEIPVRPALRTEKTAKKSEILTFIQKNKIILALGCVILIALIFILNRNPLSGNWVGQNPEDFPGTVKITGNKLEAHLSVEGNVINIKGKVKKEDKNNYSLNLLETKFSGEIKDFYDDYSSEDELIENILANIPKAIPINKNDIRQITKGFEKKGNNLVFSVDINKVSKKPIVSLIKGVASLYTNIQFEKVSDRLLKVTFQNETVELIKN